MQAELAPRPPPQAPLTEAQREGFDAAARFWGERLRPALERAAQLTGVPAGALMRSFWGAHQRVFKQLCVSLKVDERLPYLPVSP